LKGEALVIKLPPDEHVITPLSMAITSRRQDAPYFIILCAFAVNHLSTVQSLKPVDAVRCCCFLRTGYSDSAVISETPPLIWNLGDTFGASNMEAYAVHRKPQQCIGLGLAMASSCSTSRQVQPSLKELQVPQLWLLHIPAPNCPCSPHMPSSSFTVSEKAHTPNSALVSSPSSSTRVVRVHPAWYYMRPYLVHQNTSILSSQHTIA
jgi:hypothetical protein